MILSYRLGLLGRSNLSLPLLTQRAPFLPKQLLMEFSNCIETKTDSLDYKSYSKKEYMSYDLVKATSSLKYQLLKNILKGNGNEFLDYRRRELILNKFLQTVVHCTPTEIIKTLKLLVISQTKPFAAVTNLCNALSSQENYEFTEEECCDLLFSLSNLQCRHKPVIALIINYLKKDSFNFESLKVITSLLHSLSLLRIRDSELLNKLILAQGKHPFNTKANLSALVTLAILNISSPHTDNLIRPLAELQLTDFHHIKDYITFIWACILLQKFDYISQLHLENVLSANFIECIDYQYDDLHLGLKWKLLNINAGASLIPSYKGPFLHTLPQYKYFDPPVPKQNSALLKSVKDCTLYLVKKSGFLGYSVDTGMGIPLDLKCKLTPENSSNILSTPVKDVTLGIILLHHKDFCSDGEMTGMAAFKLKVLKNIGYKLVIIPHTEYPIKGKLSDKIGYLREKIRVAVESAEKDSTEDIEGKKNEKKECDIQKT